MYKMIEFYEMKVLLEYKHSEQEKSKDLSAPLRI
jgi:hypothetical protein